MPIVPVLGKLRQEDCWEFETGLGHRRSTVLNNKKSFSKPLSLQTWPHKDQVVFSKGPCKQIQLKIEKLKQKKMTIYNSVYSDSWEISKKHWETE